VQSITGPPGDRLQIAGPGVALIVFGGTRGSGFSVQGHGELLIALPDILEAIAADVRVTLASPSNPS
jgi:hypothetical protein